MVLIPRKYVHCCLYSIAQLIFAGYLPDIIPIPSLGVRRSRCFWGEDILCGGKNTFDNLPLLSGEERSARKCNSRHERSTYTTLEALPATFIPEAFVLIYCLGVCVLSAARKPTQDIGFGPWNIRRFLSKMTPYAFF